ncbi:MAG TPA: SRPBCC domain-containing protein [Acidobacteriaceae bacterium]|nr:SRPBCC domain-containing protein [Acidobacteriaceae bacterium]
MLVGKSVNVETHLPSDREIAFTCTFQRRTGLLFEAWTSPKHLRQWWGCEGSTITQCAIDLRVGGSWSLVMQMGDGSNHPFHGTYREIIRPTRLVYTEQYEMPKFGNPEWLTTVTFEKTPMGTRLTYVIQHKSRAIRDAHLQAGMQEGMAHTLTRLDQHTATVESQSRRDG